ncbi:MAG: Ku protein [Acidobacteriota bacterium]
MAARATSSATITFGLVAIPIKVYTATKSQAVRFSMLHAPDKARLKQHYSCTSCGDEVPRSDTVKGYEHARGQYVVFTDEELKALERHSDKTIAIDEFIPIKSVDPVFFEKTNLLGPDKGGSKSYRLLRQAMEESGRVALGRYSARGKQQVVILRPVDHGLMMHSLYHADEVRNFDDIDLGEAPEFQDAELTLAKQLIEQLATPEFVPDRYEDEYRKAVLAAVDKKVAGEEVVAMPEVETHEQVIDLVAALKRSLSSQTTGTATSTGRRARKPPRAKTAKKSSRRKSASN